MHEFAPWRLLLILAAVAVTYREAPAAEPSAWKVGLAQVEITPSEPVRMAGYASRGEPSQGVASPLFAKALAIEDERGHRGVLVTADLIGFTAAVAEPLCTAVTARTGLQRHQILLNVSHTHTGPIVSLDPAELEMPAEHAEATVRYTRSMQSKIVALVAESLENLAPASLAWGVGVVNFPMNRREFTDRGVILGVNPRGLSDRSVPVLRIASAEGTPRAVLFGAACHNTTLGPRDMLISGDFAGYAQAYVEDRLSGVQAQFIQGLAGDANPYPRGSEEIARRHGAELGAEVLRVLQTELTPLAGPLKTVHQPVDIPLASGLTRADVQRLREGRGGWRGFVADKMEQILDAGESLPEHYSAPVAVWQFGHELTLVALPGEVVVDYVMLLEEALGPRNLWLSAYSNDVFGYLPSARVLAEGGYETRGMYAGSTGVFAPSAETVVVERVKELAVEAGRDLEASAANP